MSKVLLATDGSDLAIAAGRRALDLLAPSDTITLLNVVELRPEVTLPAAGMVGVEPLAAPLADAGMAAEVDDALVEQGREAIDRTAAELGLGEGSDRLIAHGDPASEICRVAADGGYDVVVVGSHGSGFLRRVLLGSVSNHVAQHAPCPVLVVRAPDEEDE